LKFVKLILFITPLVFVTSCEKFDIFFQKKIVLECQSLPTFIEIFTLENNSFDVSGDFIHDVSDKNKEITDSEFKLEFKNTNRKDFQDGRYQISKITINRYTGNYKRELINFFPNSKTEKQSETYYRDGFCKVLNEKKF
jgi:hypothetical protein